MGAVVGRAYRLESQIGAGGFGTVFRGTNLQTRTPVAIKLLTRAAMLRDDSIVRRFRREAELAKRLTHESTIRVLDWGDAGNGVPFIAFELLKGVSLDTVLAKGPLPADRAVAVTLALLGSLEEAHSLGVVHRDVKPANVFLCDEPAGLVKLLDFGVAKSTLSKDLALTADGLIVGTPAYMAPEQIVSKDVTPATDLYAVGLVLAEMLTGRPVYEGSSLVVCMDKTRGLPVPLPASLKSSYFYDVIERATRGGPSARFASAAQMRDAVVAAAMKDTLPNAAAPSPAPARDRLPSSPTGTEILAAPVASLASPGSAPAGAHRVQSTIPIEPRPRDPRFVLEAYLSTAPMDETSAANTKPAPGAATVPVAPIVEAPSAPALQGPTTDRMPVAPRRSKTPYLVLAGVGLLLILCAATAFLYLTTKPQTRTTKDAPTTSEEPARSARKRPAPRASAVRRAIESDAGTYEPSPMGEDEAEEILQPESGDMR